MGALRIHRQQAIRPWQCGVAVCLIAAGCLALAAPAALAAGRRDRAVSGVAGAALPKAPHPRIVVASTAMERSRHVARRHSLIASVRAATANAVTIHDFSFQSSSITIQVGDTVTWTNDGPSQHTATANDGSFNTGVLSKGQSATHTFARAGTFQYMCSIHPFMRGSVVVRAAAAATTTPSQPSSGGSTGSAPSTPAQQGGSPLPVTGTDIPALLALGGGFLVAGWLLRRRLD